MVETGLNTIKVLLVDDYEVTRQGARSLLSDDPSINVVGEATSSNEAIALICQLRPDVGILGILLRQGSGIDVSKAIAGLDQDTKILIFTAHDDEHYVNSLIRLGATGYLLKSCSGKELLRAIHDVAEGRMTFPLEVVDKVRKLFRGESAGYTNRSQSSDLSAREAEVLALMGKGLKDREIGDILIISPRTVESHMRSILRKLGVSNRTQALIKAVRNGWLST